MSGTNAPSALALIRRHIHVPVRQEAELLARIQRQLNSEGGVNVKEVGAAARSVAVVSTRIATQLQSGVYGSSRRAGQALAEIVLHEVGHALLLRHDPAFTTGIMQSSAVVSESSPIQHFTTSNQAQIRSRLEALAATP
jgi:hypothetical protein